MEGLVSAPKLLWLRLNGNPILKIPNSRAFLVNKLFSLKALNDHVVTDQEFLKNPKPSAVYGALDRRLDMSMFQMPRFFKTDQDARAFCTKTVAAVRGIHLHTSPAVQIQRLIRGFLSRKNKLPRLERLRHLMKQLQKHIRGFLFRRRLQVRMFLLARCEERERKRE